MNWPNDTQTHCLSYENSLDLIDVLVNRPDLITSFHHKKEYLIAEGPSGEKLLEFRYPLIFPPPPATGLLTDLVGLLRPFPPPYLIVLIQAGSAALGIFETGMVLEHKVIRKYMVRKSQGKAQIKHLKSKGKSRLGSRIRLRNSETFLSEINDKCTSWLQLNPADRILYSCSETLWHLLFQADPPPPFQKDSSLLRRIPIDVHLPNHEELLRINDLALQGNLTISDQLDLPISLA